MGEKDIQNLASEMISKIEDLCYAEIEDDYYYIPSDEIESYLADEIRKIVEKSTEKRLTN